MIKKKSVKKLLSKNSIKKIAIFLLISIAFITVTFATTSITDTELKTNQIEVNNVDLSENSLSISQNTSQFVKTIGGSGYDRFYSMDSTSDGGYIMTGYTQLGDIGTVAVFVVKFNPSGDISWAKAIGSNEGYDYGNDIRQTSDGGYVIGGKTTSYGNYTNPPDAMDWMVIKLDSSGNLSWAKIIGEDGTDDFVERECVHQTSDGGYIMTGYTESYGGSDKDAFVVKLDSSGSVSWSKVFGESSFDNFLSIQQTSDGGYIASGATDSYGKGGHDILIAKLDSSGNLSWMKAYGEGSNEVAESNIIQTSDGGYVVTGYTKSYEDSDGDLFVLKLDSSGNIDWFKTIGEAGFSDVGFSIQQISEGGYVVWGRTESYGARGWDAFVVKLDPSGDFSWARTVGGTSDDVVNSIQQTSDGGYVMGGHTDSYGAGNTDFLLAKLNSSGECSGCSLIQDQTDNVSVSSPDPTITEVIPEISSPTPNITSVTPNVTDVTPEVSTQCSATSTFSSLVTDSTGRISIGKPNPEKNLDVRGDIRADRFCFKDNCYSSMSESPWTKYGNNIIFNTGKIGIGTSLPKNKINIIGDINITGDYINNNNTGITGNYTNGNCWTYYSGGIVTETNCTSV